MKKAPTGRLGPDIVFRKYFRLSWLQLPLNSLSANTQLYSSSELVLIFS
jgi:hypothetical protein